MHVGLIIPYSDITSFGIRMISACLRQAGHQVTLIFLNDPHSESVSGEYQYHASLIDQVIAVLDDMDLVGCSLMTLYAPRIQQLTTAIKKRLSIPVVWGGIHPTIRPESCLQWADFVVVGEADRSFPNLVNALQRGDNPVELPGVWFKQGSRTIRGAPNAPENNLDTLPWPDYSPEAVFALDPQHKTLVPCTPELEERLFRQNPIWQMGNHVYYQTMATRGCPHNCAYCCNSALRQVYGGNWHVRYRSPEHVVGELKQITQQYPYLSAVVFSDDSFFSYPLHQLEKFAELYTQEVGLPFRCLTSPLTLDRNKLEVLLDAGLFSVQMGIQSGSRRIQKIYKRAIRNERVLGAAKLLNEYNERMAPPLYDFILDNPLETVEDQIATFELVKQLPRPYVLQLFSLVVFPGTELHSTFSEQAVQRENDAFYRPFSDYSPTYGNMLMLMFHHRFPQALMNLLTRPAIVRFFSINPGKLLVTLIFGGWKKMKHTVQAMMRHQ